MRVVRPGLVAALVVGLLAAGCGDGDGKQSNAYVDAVNKAQNDFAATFDRLSKQITTTSTPRQDRQTLEGFQRAVDEVVADLRAVDAPEKVRGLHAQLVSEIASYGEQIQKAKAAFASSDPQKILAAQTDLVRAVTTVSERINRTIAAINRKLRE